MIAVVLLASWFSFLESPMERFAEQYYEESYKSKIVALEKLEAAWNTKCMQENEDFEYEMTVRRRNTSISEDKFDAYEIQVLSNRCDRSYKQFLQFCEQKKTIEKEHKSRRHEYDLRKKAFKLCGGEPTASEAAALEKFKNGGCKIKKLTSEEKELLYAWFIRGSAKWGMVRYKRGHPYISQ